MRYLGKLMDLGGDLTKINNFTFWRRAQRMDNYPYGYWTMGGILLGKCLPPLDIYPGRRDVGEFPASKPIILSLIKNLRRSLMQFAAAAANAGRGTESSDEMR
jgi:hypothetical protein